MKYGYRDIHELTTLAYLDARRHERTTTAQLEFEVDQERNLARLASQLSCRNWKPGAMDWFVLNYPTIREVFAPAFRDRVVSHVLFNMIAPIFERYFIHDSFSCRKGKGTLYGIERFEHHIRSVTDNYRRDAWCLNIDISGYFMSIDRSRLYRIIWKTLDKNRERYPDEIDYDFADYLICSFLFRDPLEGCHFIGRRNLIHLVPSNKSLFTQEKGVGLPIGDVGNQLNSNIYLNELDHFVKRTLGVRNYCRYVDDARILRADYVRLLEDRDRVAEFLDRELALTLHPIKTKITSLYETNYFLGAAIKPHRRYVQNDSLRRFRKFIREADESLADGTATADDILPTLNARLGYLRHFDERMATRKALESAEHVLDTFAIYRDMKKATIKQQQI